MINNDIQNDLLFSQYSDQDLIEAFDNIDSEKFPDRYQLLILEIKSRKIDPLNSVVYYQKKKAANVRKPGELFVWIVKRFEDKRNVPRILFKIIVSALISAFTVAFGKFSYIEGFRGKYHSNSSEMTYREACTYLRETLDKSMNLWLITFLLTLAYFVWKEKKS